MNLIVVKTHQKPTGFDVFVDSQRFEVTYPLVIWQSFPQNLRQQFAETVAFYFTYHLYFKDKKPLNYQFSPSLTHSLFINGLLMVLPEAILEISKAKFTALHLFEMLYQSQHELTYSPQTLHSDYKITPYAPNEKKVMIPLSMGKDSLLTFGITRELGLDQTLVFFVEPHSQNEIKNKLALGKEFMNTFQVPITYIPVSLGALREAGGTQWGWDLILTEYTLLSLPFLHFNKIGYFLWSQEQNYHIPTTTPFGLTLTMNYDETKKWRLMLTQLLSYFGSPAVVGSLNEPLMEFTDVYILHHRYPEIARFHLSCDNDHKNARKSRWCHACAECSRFYIYLLAMGVDPARVGIRENMLLSNKLRYSDVLEKETGYHYTYQFATDTLFALYLVYKRGIKGAVVDRFKKMYLERMEKEMSLGLLNKYTSLHSSQTIPSIFKPRVLAIYKEELANMRTTISQFV